MKNSQLRTTSTATTLALAVLTATTTACVPLPSTNIDATNQVRRRPHDSFRLMTFNIVHGTRLPLPSWIFLSDSVRSRLSDIALQAVHHDADVIALQEADGDARFDRTREISDISGLSHLAVARGEQSHGATLASRIPMQVLHVERFSQRRSDPKGFVIGRTHLATGDEFDIVSVHLDAFSADLRERQTEELLSSLHAVQQQHGRRPLVVMGDFNEGYTGATQRIAESLSLTTLDTTTPTYTDFGLHRRLDWILVSAELEMVSHQVLDGNLSDHHPIVADIRVRRSHANDSARSTKNIR